MNVEKTWLYSLARALLTVYYGLFFRVRAKGVQNFPSDKNCILLCNHISAWDPITIALQYKHNEIHFFAKDTLFKNKFLSSLLTKLHAIPVKRGETDMKAMRASMQVIKDGHVFGIFPEGHRYYDGELKPLETGVAVMALKSRVPVVPIWVQGTYKLFGKIQVNIGKAMHLDAYWEKPSNAETLEEIKKEMTQALQNLQER